MGLQWREQEGWEAGGLWIHTGAESQGPLEVPYEPHAALYKPEAEAGGMR